MNLLTDVFIRRDYGDIKDNITIIDIGANIGAFTLYSVYNKNNICYAFEPEIQNFKKLKENIEINNLSGKVKMYNLAIAGNKDDKKLYKFESISHSFTRTGDDFDIVHCTDLNSFIETNNISQVDYLKMDCEGAEFEILYSIKDEIFKKIRYMCIEYHNYSQKAEYNDNTLLKFLKSKGYDILEHNETVEALVGIIKARLI
jgi:FkbM family methyltransferase